MPVIGEIKGDVPALGRMVITDTGGADRWSVLWGLQSRYYDAAASAALFYEAEGRTPLGGATAVAGAAGASGAGSNVVRQGTLTPGRQAVLSTQAVSAGAHLSHVGSFEVLARLYMPTSNTGAVSVALEWGQGDFRRRTVNDAVDFDVNHAREGQFVLGRLGQVHLSEVSQGTQRWEGRIIASSTVAGDDLDVDWIALVPITEGSGELSGLLQFENPTSFSVRDEFDQAAGVLVAKTLPVGGVWAGAGDADDFAVETAGHTAQRVTAADVANVGHFARAGTITFTAIEVRSDVNLISGETLGGGGDLVKMGVLARYTDTSNYLQAYVEVTEAAPGVGAPVAHVVVRKCVAATITEIGRFEVPVVNVATWYTIALHADPAGRWRVWWWVRSSLPVLVGAGQDSVLATGGTLATGKVGIYDEATGGGGIPDRAYDNFMAFVPTTDAAIFASQSLELTHQGAERKNSTGTFWSPVSNVEGDYLKLAPAGREGRVNRLIVVPFRNDPDGMGDPGGAANVSVQVFATLRGVSIPTP